MSPCHFERVKTPPLGQGVCQSCSEVDVSTNTKAPGLQAGPHRARDCSVVIHTQEGLVETSRLVSSGTGTIYPRRPAQASGILPHLLLVGPLHLPVGGDRKKCQGNMLRG